MTKLEQWEQLEAYYAGTLPADTQRQLEQELAHNADLRAEADAIGTARAALAQVALDALVRQTIRQELNTYRPATRWRMRGRWVAAAAVLTVLLLGYLTFSRVDMGTYRNDLTLTDRYRPGPDSPPDEGELTSAQRAFYRDFFDAQMYLATGQPRLAIEKLEKLATVEGVRPYFREAIQWHLLNAYLLDNQPDNAAATYERLTEAATATYPIDRLDRWKVWWQIQWQRL